MKIVITGSHFTPAQAVIEELKKFPDIEILYIGRKTTREGDSTPSVESEVIPKLGVKFSPIITGRLQRRFTFYTIPSLLKIPIGFIQSLLILLKFNPDVVLSFGGYVAVPVVINSWFMSIPIIVHEQTLVSGLANRISNIFASKIAVSFDKAYSFNKNKIVLTGNPMRGEVVRPQKLPNSELKTIITLAEKARKPIILVMGGNQGSHVINEAIKKIISQLIEKAFVIHQTGDSKFDDWSDLSNYQKTLKNPERYLVKKWIEDSDVGYILPKLNLAISRAGINTFLEFAYFGIPTLAIPVPHIYKDEQIVNAKFFNKAGLAEVFSQSKLNDHQAFLAKIKEMLSNNKKLIDQAKAAKELVIPDAAKRLAQETLLLAGQNDA